MYHHTSPDAPLQRGVLVVGEVHSGRFLQQPEQRVEVAALHTLNSFHCRRHNPRHVRMLADPAQLSRNVLRRQDKVDVPCIHRIARHAVVLRRLLVLRKRDASRRFDGPASFGPVRCRSRQDHADRLLPGTFRQRTKKIIDGHVLTVRDHARTQLQHSILDAQARIGRNHVGVVGLNHNPLGYLSDRDLRCPRENFLQRTAMSGVEMLHQYEGHAGFFRHITQQFGECFEPARRRPDPHNGERSSVRLSIILRGNFTTWVDLLARRTLHEAPP